MEEVDSESIVEEAFQKFYEFKDMHKTQDLCFGNTKDFDKLKREIFGYRFKDEPDYSLLKQMLEQIIEGSKVEKKGANVNIDHAKNDKMP